MFFSPLARRMLRAKLRALTIEEVAEKLGVSYSTVQRMIKRGQLPGLHRLMRQFSWGG